MADPAIDALVEALRGIVYAAWDKEGDKEWLVISAVSIEYARAALAAWDAVPTGWRPIETAPADGTDILAIVAGNHPQTGRPFIPEVVEWTDRGWWNCMWDGEDDRTLYLPTHFMPLPAPPAPLP